MNAPVQRLCYVSVPLEPRSVVELLRRVAVTHFYVLLLALGIGVVAGLRSMTAPAVVAWEIAKVQAENPGFC